jgi:hypothetical protein
MIAALFVAETAATSTFPASIRGRRSATRGSTAGPYPVVAHPPCQRWGKFWAGQPLHIKLTPAIRKVKGSDGGCFESALSSVRSLRRHP